MTAGDCCILREVTAGESSNSTSYTDYDWDTEVHRDSGSFTLSGTNGIQCADAGPYLVIYNNSYLGGGSNRSELRNRIEIDGTRTLYGQSSGYIRRSGDSYSSQCGMGIIETTSANQVVSIARGRTDSNTGGGTCTRQANECGFSVVKLDDSWSYFRGIDITSQSLTHASGETPPVTAASFEWQDVLVRIEDRKDTGFLHSTTVNPAEITLDGARRYLVCYSVKFQNPSTSVRVNGLCRLVYDGVQVPASVATAYGRGSNGCQDPVACGAVLFSPTGRNKVLKLQAACDQEGTGTLNLNEVAISIVDLGLDIDVAILRESADHDHNVGRTSFDAITWDTQDVLDTGEYSHSTSTDPSQLGVTSTNRHLVWSSFFHVRTGINTTRKRPRVKFRANTTLGDVNYQYGLGDNFNRGDQSSTSSWTAGGIGGGVFDATGIDSFEAGGCDPASTVDSSTAWAADDCALFAISLDSMDSSPAPITGTLSTSTPAPTADIDGDYTPGAITGTVTTTTPSTEASLAGDYTPGAITGTLGATTPSVLSSINGTYTPEAITGTLTGTTPSLDAAFSGIRGVPGGTGTLNTSTPVPTADFAGTYTPPAITGTLSSSTAAPTAALQGTVSGVPGITGSLAALTPIPTAAFQGLFPAPLEGTLIATTPSVIAGFVGEKQADPITGTLSSSTPLIVVRIENREPGIPGTVRPRPSRPADAPTREALTGVWRQREAL